MTASAANDRIRVVIPAAPPNDGGCSCGGRCPDCNPEPYAIMPGCDSCEGDGCPDCMRLIDLQDERVISPATPHRPEGSGRVTASDEKDEPQWAVRAENGVTCRASEDLARAAMTEGGYTLGINRSPIVEALFRSDANAEWQSFDPGVTPPTDQKGADQ